MKSVRKKILTALGVVLMLCVVIGMIPHTAYAAEGDTVTATEAELVDGVYQIGTADQLYWFAELVNSGETNVNAVLTADITVNENLLNEDGSLAEGTFREWTPIGTRKTPYSGTFDGQGFTVSGLYYYDDATYGFADTAPIIGLFGSIVGGNIQNVNVADSYFLGYNMVGGLVGYGKNITVTGCSSQGNTVRALHNDAAGLIAYCENGMITACFNTSAVSGDHQLAGIVGRLIDGNISYCYNEGSIDAVYSSTAGIVGYFVNGTVDKCYNLGQITGGTYGVGSVVGYNQGTVTDCCYLKNTVISDDYYQAGIGELIRYTYGRDEESVTTSLTAEQFANGAAAYVMGNSPADSTFFWGQNLDNGEPRQDMPVLGSAKVYGTYVDGCRGVYSNSPYDTQPEPVHNAYDNGYCAVCGVQQAVTDSDGDGYYEIGNMGQLYDFAWRVNHGENSLNAILTADITVNEGVLNEDGTLAEGEFINWPVIAHNNKPYTGSFDGRSYTVSGLYFNSPTKYGRANLGMFGYAQEATIKNLGVNDSYFYGNVNIGGVIGECAYSSVSNCWFSGTVVADMGVGGIVCSMVGGSLENCYNLGTVISINEIYPAGIVGGAQECEISNCYNAGKIGYDNESNIAGYVQEATMLNCYYLADEESDELDGTAAKTAAQFASGEVAYLLNGESSDGELTWFQTCGEGYPEFNGKTVYQVTDCKGDDFYSNTNENISHSYGDDGICGICGDGSSVPEQPVITLQYPSLSFESEVFYNVYFTASNTADVEEMGLITWYTKPASQDAAVVENAEAIIPGAVYNAGNDTYMARSQGIPAKQLGDDLYLRVYAKLSDGTYVYSSVQRYSAKSYAADILQNSSNANMKSLVVAMLNYGAAAQVHFNHNTDKLMNADLTPEQKALVVPFSDSMISSLVAVDKTKTANFVYNKGFSDGYPSVSFEGALAINYYLIPKYEVTGDFTLYCWDLATYNSVSVLTEDNATATATMSQASSSYVGAFAGLAAKQIDETVFAVAVYESNGTRYVSPVFAYSIGAYCKDRIANGGDTMKAFAAETAVYGFYAKAYFASLEG